MSDSEFELTDELASLIEALHDSEINWFFDRVWRAKIGDLRNGYQAETDGLPSLAEAARWLCDKALQIYPDSNFAKKYLALRWRRGTLPILQPIIPCAGAGQAAPRGTAARGSGWLDGYTTPRGRRPDHSALPGRAREISARADATGACG